MAAPRSTPPDGRARRFLEALAAIRECLTSDGRTLVQGALGWLCGRSATAVPIPGVQDVAQAEENAGALAQGPLAPDTMRQIEVLLARRPR